MTSPTLTLTGVAGGDILQFDSALGVFLPVPVPSSGVPLPSSAPSAVDEVLAVDTVSPLTTKWRPPGEWTELGRVTTTGATSGATVSEPSAGAWSAYTRLRITVVNQTTTDPNFDRNAVCRFNGVSASSYSYAMRGIFVAGNGAVVESTQSSASDSVIVFGVSPSHTINVDARSQSVMEAQRTATGWFTNSRGSGTRSTTTVTTLGINQTVGGGRFFDDVPISSVFITNNTGQTRAGFTIIVEGRVL
jgi:hypothetical protein